MCDGDGVLITEVGDSVHWLLLLVHCGDSVSILLGLTTARRCWDVWSGRCCEVLVVHWNGRSMILFAPCSLDSVSTCWCLLAVFLV